MNLDADFTENNHHLEGDFSISVVITAKIDESFNPNSPNAQSGMAIAEALRALNYSHRDEVASTLKKAMAYTDNEIATFDFIKIVQSLPEVGLVNRTYFVPKSDPQVQDLYDEYMWINKGTEEEPDWGWELITTKKIEVDLTDYATIHYVDQKIGDIENALDNVITKYGLGGDII